MFLFLGVLGAGVFAFFFCFVLSSRIRSVSDRQDRLEGSQSADSRRLADLRRRLRHVERVQEGRKSARDAAGPMSVAEGEDSDAFDRLSLLERRLAKVEEAAGVHEDEASAADRAVSDGPADEEPLAAASDRDSFDVSPPSVESEHVPPVPEALRIDSDSRMVEPVSPSGEPEPGRVEPVPEPAVAEPPPDPGPVEAEPPPERTTVPPAESEPHAVPESVSVEPRRPSVAKVPTVLTPPMEHPAAAALTSATVGDRIRKLLIAVFDLIKIWATTGNVPVKVGVLLSLLGLAFLLRVAVERGIIILTIEMGLTAASLFGIALLVLGWRVRRRRPLYGLSLEGGGIAVLYLTTYVSHAVADVIPVLVASVSVVAITVGAGVLSVAQDSRSLAVLGMIGGFLAPILAYSNAEDHVLVFSFYVVLSAAIVAVSWFKIWPELNLLGLGFTLGLTSFWLLMRYRSEDWVTTQPLIAILIFLYMTIPLLFAVRQKPNVKGLMTSPLVFGVPFAGLAIQFYLTPDNIPNLPAYSALVLAIVHGVFAVVARRCGRQWKSLEEVYYALAATFAAIAVPLALNTQYISIVWTLQGTMLVLIGIRHARVLYQWGGPLLQILGLAFFILYTEDSFSNTGDNVASFSARFLKDSVDSQLVMTSLTLALVYSLSPILLRTVGRTGDKWRVAADTYVTIGMALLALSVFLSFDTEIVAMLLALQGSIVVWFSMRKRRVVPALAGFTLQGLGIVFFGTYLLELLPNVGDRISGWSWPSLVELLFYGPTLVPLILAVGYAVFSALIRRWGGVSEEWRLLEEVYLLVGMVFLWISTFLTFDSEWVSVILAIQGTLVAWWGIRQARKISAWGGGLLQTAGAVFFVRYVLESLPYSDGFVSGRLWGFLIDNFEYGPTLVALVLAIGYTVFSVLLRRSRRVREGWQSLEGGYLVVGMIFLQVAFLLSLEIQYVAVAWSLQGTALVWLGVRQHRSSQRDLGFLLQILGAAWFAIYLSDTLPYGEGVGLDTSWTFLVGGFEYGPAGVGLVLAVVYTVFSILLSRPGGSVDSSRVMRETYLVVGMVFLALAAILSFDLEYVSMAWVVQGVVLFWLGIRHRRSVPTLIGATLQASAGLCFFVFGTQSLPYPDVTTPLANRYFVPALLLALTGLITGRLLDRAADVASQIGGIRWLALTWGVGWWLAAGLLEIINQLPTMLQLNASLAFVTVSLGGLVFVGRLLGWQRLRFVGVMLLPTLVAALVLSFDVLDHPLAHHGWAAWIVAFVTYYLALRDLESELPRTAGTMHVVAYWVLAVLVGREVYWQVDRAAAGIWPIAVALAVVLAIVSATMATRRTIRWPIGAHWRTYLMAGTGPVLLVLSGWVLVLDIVSPGDPAPLTYLPLLNPLELLTVLAAVVLLAWRKLANSAGKQFLPELGDRRFGPILALLGLVLLTVAVARTVHHWEGVPFDMVSMTFSTTLQASVAIVWAVGGLTGMIVGVRTARRMIWVAGASLMMLVVAKLFLFDLRHTGTVARVVSFLGVGVLLLIVGYFAPVPPSASARTREPKAEEN